MESLSDSSDCNERRKFNTCIDDDDAEHISKLSDDILIHILSRLTIKEAARSSILSSRWRYLWKSFKHISKLSDAILVNILSRLTIKEAARTSILSTRWRYLWRYFTGCLTFDNPMAMVRYPFKYYDVGSDSFEVKRFKFVSWVNHVLSSLQGQSSIEQLSICCDISSQADVDNWIKFAVEKRVKKLRLDFTGFTVYSLKGRCTFPSHDNIPYSSFSSLTSLSLTLVDITGDVLENLLSHCPLLQVLSVQRSLRVKKLKVSGGPSHDLKLKYLKLYFWVSQYIEIDNAPNLIYFEYGGNQKIPISFRNVPNLAEIPGAVCYNIPELCNLKHLEIKMGIEDDHSLLPCAAYLKAFPSLYKFTLKVSWPVKPSSGMRRSVRNHPFLGHSELSIRVVELVGFAGQTTDSEFVIYLIENAKLLEKIIIDPCIDMYRGTPTELLFRESELYQSAIKQATHLAVTFPLWNFIPADFRHETEQHQPRTVPLHIAYILSFESPDLDNIWTSKRPNQICRRHLDPISFEHIPANFSGEWHLTSHIIESRGEFPTF
ncbi:FBD-associated F-box protein [Melia azedarach]|uniref:FBD-associated F-box protein n=1 Tax=Melia azedarach TaxID=155640 RepID=A0ACC1X3I5_MELAZ|nr:FBD-associated F-box protein [Melia azedarach]